MKLDGIRPIPAEPETSLTPDGRVRVLIDIPEQDGNPAFRDALYYTTEEYEALSAKDLDAARWSRFYAFVDAVKNPPAPEPPAADEALQQAMDALAAAQTAVQAVIAATAVEAEPEPS